VKDDFVNALESLMLQQTRFDYIIIETTGLADPGPVASALWTDEEVEAGAVWGQHQKIATLRGKLVIKMHGSRSGLKNIHNNLHPYEQFVTFIARW
jgi:hypothetical protein